MIERDELAAWLRLLALPQVGRDAARRLLAAFGTPENVLAAPPAARRRVAPAAADLGADAARALDERVEAAWRWLEGGERRAVLTLGDAGYPPLLLETADPPLLLFLHGRAELLCTVSIAVVGSRNPTPQGADNARAFAAHLSRGGLAVVSGLALGIDGAAHEGALEGAGSTVAVVGTGLDRVYPRSHLELARRIAASGLLVSEYPPGTPPLPAHFPQRNRIIAGLSRGTLVVEAALRSGSLITARLSAEAGREVFAIPGSIHAPQSRGCHALIRQGAKLVERADDILEELRLDAATPRPAAAAPASPRSAADPLLDALGWDPVTLDALVARTGLPAATLGARLLELELDGLVARLPGQLFQRAARA